MPYAARNSMTQRGNNTVSIENGRIINVDTLHFLADVRTLYSQRSLTNLQWANPYLHFAGGEGITYMPEVGAICQVCFPSDTKPFILCFLTTYERGSSGSDNVPTRPTSPDQTSTPLEVTYQAGRPDMQQGDILLQTRDKNMLFLRRGGVVEIGSTAICKRYYIPLLNTIRDFCENYEMNSIAGDMGWTVQRSDTSPNGEAFAYFTLASRNTGQDSLASVFLRVGHVDLTNRLQLLISPKTINPKTGEFSGDISFKLEITESGSVVCEVLQDVDITIKGSLTETIQGNNTTEIQGNSSETINGSGETKITGSHKLESQTSNERHSSLKLIDAPSIKLGSGAVFPVVLASPAFISYILGHTHTVSGPTTTPPIQTIPPNSFTARKIIGE
jgi:hypothetical protein